MIGNQRVQTHRDGRKELWRDVVGFEGVYRCSDWATVKSIKRLVRKWDGWKTIPTKILKPFWNGRYLAVGLYRDGKGTTRILHHLVLEAFVGPRPNGFVGCHNDDDRSNNNLTNLRWDKPKSNYEDRKNNGGDCPGEKNGNSKANETDVLAMRKMYAAGGRSFASIARELGYGTMLVYRVIKRMTWQHLP